MSRSIVGSEEDFAGLYILLFLPLIIIVSVSVIVGKSE